MKKLFLIVCLVLPYVVSAGELQINIWHKTTHIYVAGLDFFRDADKDDKEMLNTDCRNLNGTLRGDVKIAGSAGKFFVLGTCAIPTPK